MGKSEGSFVMTFLTLIISSTVISSSTSQLVSVRVQNGGGTLRFDGGEVLCLEEEVDLTGDEDKIQLLFAFGESASTLLFSLSLFSLSSCS